MELVAVSHTWFWSPDTGPWQDHIQTGGKICREILPMAMSGFVNKPLWWKCIQAKALKRKCRPFDKILIIGCTGSCYFDNFQCSQWWKFHQNDNISVSVRDGQTKAPKIQMGSMKSYVYNPLFETRTSCWMIYPHWRHWQKLLSGFIECGMQYHRQGVCLWWGSREGSKVHLWDIYSVLVKI